MCLCPSPEPAPSQRNGAFIKNGVYGITLTYLLFSAVCLILGSTFLKDINLYRFRTRKMFNVVVTFSNKGKCVFGNSLAHGMNAHQSVCMYKNLFDSD